MGGVEASVSHPGGGASPVHSGTSSSVPMCSTLCMSTEDAVQSTKVSAEASSTASCSSSSQAPRIVSARVGTDVVERPQEASCVCIGTDEQDEISQVPSPKLTCAVTTGVLLPLPLGGSAAEFDEVFSEARSKYLP